jgi:hypothetical protein
MKMARPPKPIDWNLVERKMEAGCTATEIAWDFRMHIDTFSERFKQEYGKYFTEYAGNFHSVGKGNVRHQQYERAMDGNTQMLTILGREWLGQEKEQKQRSQIDEDRLDALLNQLQSLRSSSNQATNNNNKEDKS